MPDIPYESILQGLPKITPGVILISILSHGVYTTWRALPYDDYVDGVLEAGRKKDAPKIDALVKQLASVGAQQLVRMSKGEKMNDVWQLRSGRHRIFFFYDSGSQTYVLLNGFLKQSNRTP